MLKETNLKPVKRFQSVSMLCFSVISECATGTSWALSGHRSVRDRESDLEHWVLYYNRSPCLETEAW